MSTHHAEATVAADGSVLIRDVPFPSGQVVEVIVQTPAKPAPADKAELWKTLAGKPFKYIDPCEPAVPPEDWDVYR